MIEITSKSTKGEDKKTKFELYRDILKVSEYFMFDPTQDYLNPPLQGFRLLVDTFARFWAYTLSETVSSFA